MLPRHISGVNINNPELNRSHRRGGDHPKRWRQHIERCLGFAAPSGAQSGQLCINYPPPLLASLLLPTYIPPFFCPQKVHYSHGAVGSQGRSAALYCASRFPLSSRNTIQQRRKLKDEMEDGGKRSRGVTDATATTMRRWTMDSG